jgi:hypothetical protein
MGTNFSDAVLVQAYLAALSQGGKQGTGRDPVKNVIFDESIEIEHQRLFSFLEVGSSASDTINTVNIQNAATLYAIMIIGDEMGVFRVADTIMKYAAIGRIDVASSTTATRLYGYMKLRDQRTTREEREMFYYQCFNVGGSGGMEGVVGNAKLWPLCESLFHETIRYIEKYETADTPSNISQNPIRQGIRVLQHNLSRAASGMCKIFIPEMYAHLEDAIQIINAPEIRDQLGQGVARDLWNVIEQVSMEEFGSVPNTSALRDVARQGRKMFLDIASYTDTDFDSTDFQDFVSTVEGFVVAQSQLDGSKGLREGVPRLGFGGEGARTSEDTFDGHGSNGYTNGNGSLQEDDWSF